MNVYDTAHQLARTIKQSPEFSGFMAAKVKVDEQEGTSRMLKDLRAKQWELQQLRMSGQEPSQDQMENFQKLAGLISHSPLLQEYLAAEYRFGQMMEDVQKILADVMQELMPEAEKE